MVHRRRATARRLAALRRALRGASDDDRGLLERIRRLFVALNLFAAATNLLDVDDTPAGLVKLASALALGAWAVCYHQRHGRGVLVNVLPFALLLVRGLSGGVTQGFVVTMYAAALLQGLYAHRHGRRVALVAGHTCAYVPAALTAQHAISQWIVDLSGVAFVAGIMGMVSVAVARSERLQQRDRALARVVSDLLTERDPERAARAVTRAALALADGPGARAGLWRVDGRLLRRVAVAGAPDDADLDAVDLDDLPADLQATWQRGEAMMVPRDDVRRVRCDAGAGSGDLHVVSAPIHDGDGAAGLLVISSPEPLDDDLVEVLRRFAAEVSLVEEVLQRDATQRRLEAEIVHQTFHDGLTGLANRPLFLDRLEAACRASERGGAGPAVLVVGIDDFKRVNEALGHQHGDQLLRDTAQRIATVTRGADTAARLGGDEFAVLVPGTPSATQLAEIAERLLAAVAEEMPVAGRTERLTASVGIAIRGGGDATRLLEDATTAMGSAKAAGKNRWAIFDPATHARVRERRWLAAELQAAMGTDQLRLAYQPIVSLSGAQHDVVGFEALLRWQHPVRGAISPADFVPLAESTGLIVPLGAWVLRAACQQLRAWDRAHPTGPRPYMSVNLSPVQLRRHGIVDDVARAIAHAGIDAGRLVLEVTETALMHDVDDIAGVLDELRALGVRIAIDDFGTGYSSFAHLQRLPADVLKVDRSFVAAITGGTEQAAPAEAIVKLAGTLGMDTVAEGVEEPAQARILRSWGCRAAQGWLWSPALPPGDAVRFLAERDELVAS